MLIRESPHQMITTSGHKIPHSLDTGLPNAEYRTDRMYMDRTYRLLATPQKRQLDQIKGAA